MYDVIESKSASEQDDEVVFDGEEESNHYFSIKNSPN